MSEEEVSPLKALGARVAAAAVATVAKVSALCEGGGSERGAGRQAGRQWRRVGPFLLFACQVGE